MMQIADRYSLFYADNGEKRHLETGFPISTEVTIGNKKYYADLYASFWGLWASPLFKDDGEYIDSSQVIEAMESGHKVEKVDYVTNTKNEYTMKKTSARLNEITRKTLTLDDVKMLPIRINSYGSIYDGYTVIWTGDKLAIAGKDRLACIEIDANKEWDYSNEVKTAFEVTEDWQCGCLDTTVTDADAQLRKTGDWEGRVDTDTDTAENYYIAFKEQSVKYIVAKMDEFKPTASMFPHGLNFDMNGFWATLILKYEEVQILHGLDFGTYYIGQKVEQDLGNGKKAVGTINEATPIMLLGLQCPTITVKGWIEDNYEIEIDDWWGKRTEYVKVIHVTEGEIGHHHHQHHHFYCYCYYYYYYYYYYYHYYYYHYYYYHYYYYYYCY